MQGKKEFRKNNLPGNAGKRLQSTTVPLIKPGYYVALAIILLITFLSYWTIIHNGFVNWDDDKYIQGNLLIKSIDLKRIFSSYFIGNYHPLTILIYAIEYHLFGLNAGSYHTVSLVLHLLNVILVFYAIFLLSNKIEVALIASLLFGIHPIHVESVAWASELKDLLYTFFFLASYTFYLKYLRNKSTKFYIFSVLLFLFSLLSKAMAVSLPLVLILTDYFIRKDSNGKTGKITSKMMVEKIPFFTLSLIFGVVSVFAQHALNSIHDISFYTLPQRIIFACYGFISYLLKLIAPVNLCAFYPYPMKSGESLPTVYYIYPVLFLAFIITCYLSIRFTKRIIFGIGFFAATVFLVLQLLPVGDAVMADRYCYIPSFGIFYLAGEGLSWLWIKVNKTVAVACLAILTLFFSVKTYAMCGTWKDGMTLWNDVISHYQTIPIAYNNRGYLLMNDHKDKEALSDFNKAIELNPKFSDPYNNRAMLLRSTGKLEDVLSDLNKALELNKNYVEAYNNRGNLFAVEKKYDEALNDFNRAINISPEVAESFNNRGTVYMKEKLYTEAINDFNRAIELKNDYAMAYANRGISELNSAKNDRACLDLKKSIELGFPAVTDLYNQRCK